MSFSDDEQMFEVQEVVEQRKRKGILEYLVRWKGAGDGTDSWEPAKKIEADCPIAIQLFQEKSKGARGKRSTSRSRKVSRSRSRSSSRSRKSRSSAKKSQSRSRSRGRDQKKTPKTEESSDKAAKKIVISESKSSTSVETDSKSSVEHNSNSVKKETKSEQIMPVTQRVTRSATAEARKELEVQRVHNDQRPVREDDNKPRSAIWKIADYAVIALFVLSLIAALVLFLEKFYDLENFKPSLSVLQRRLASAQQRLVDLASYGADLVSDTWLYLMDQIGGQSGGAAMGKESSGVPKQGASSSRAPGA